jgi:ribosomal protein RSM22 (predicted rRNA methylase)
MRLPGPLHNDVALEVEKVDRGRLQQACSQLTEQYQAGRFASPVISSDAHRAAYLAVRLPATYAAVTRVLAEVRRLAAADVRSLLDLGAGPGTALHAAAELFPGLQRATMIEADAGLIGMGRRLASQSPHAVARDAQWIRQDMRSAAALEPHDLVVISYALGEMPAGVLEKLVAQAWAAAREFLVVVEPGTVRGFGLVHAARSLLINSGAHILAPCPHALACPMAAAGDWCHFAERVERTSLHRQLKGGSLGYEDEKFSYVAASRNAFPVPPARIVRHPRKNSGHVRLTLCTAEGLRNPTITKAQKEAYKKARKAQWGDDWMTD